MKYLILLLLAYIADNAEGSDYKEIECLAKNIYFEARGEPFEGQLAIAFVTFERVLSPRYPNTFCEAVWAPGAFSWTKDDIPNNPEDIASYQSIYELSEAFYHNAPFKDPTYGALYYHATWITPCWLPDSQFIIQIGKHKFYTVDPKGVSCWRNR